MGKLKGILKIEGTVGAVNFAKTKNGIIVREKSGVSADRIAKDPAFVRTRENNTEFARAGKAAKLLYDALRTTAVPPGDNAFGRLLQVTMAALKADGTHPRDKRTVAGGDLSKLVGWELNPGAKLAAVLRAPYTTEIVRSDAYLSVTFPAFDPREVVKAPVEATHFEVFALGLAADFELGVGTAKLMRSTRLPLEAPLASALALEGELTPRPRSASPLVLGVGVSFYQQVNGVTYPLQGGGHSALALVAVDG